MFSYLSLLWVFYLLHFFFFICWSWLFTRQNGTILENEKIIEVQIYKSGQLQNTFKKPVLAFNNAYIHSKYKFS